MLAHVHVEEGIAVVDADAAHVELFHLHREVIHPAQSEVADLDVRRFAARVFAVGYAADGCIVFRAAEGIIHHNRHTGQVAEFVQRLLQFVGASVLVTSTLACKLCIGEVYALVGHTPSFL